MKSAIVLALTLTIVGTISSGAEITNEADCKCWENFKPEKEEGQTGYHCRGIKHFRIFGCNEEKPPICKCQINGKTVELDLGETNCLSVRPLDDYRCDNTAEWAVYFKKHPERQIYH